MRGQILSASTDRSGIVLDDNGARYTFVSDEWRNVSVRAEPGMTVEFIPQGSMATNIQPAAIPTNSAPPAPAATNYRPAAPAPAATNYQPAAPAPAAANYQAAPPPPPPPPAPRQAWSGGSNPYPPPGQTGWNPTVQQSAPSANYGTPSMRGPILSTSDSQTGIVLGDSGVCYSFQPRSWRSVQVIAEPGMIVEFIPQGETATNVRYTGEPYERPRSWRDVPSIPEHLKTKKVLVGLILILAGPFALLVFPLYFGYRGAWAHSLLALIAFPIFFILWPISVIVGIYVLLMPEEGYINYLHQRREHDLCGYGDSKDPGHCNTGECRMLY